MEHSKKQKNNTEAPSKKLDVSVIIPAHNEAAAVENIIHEVFQALKQYKQTFEVLVIDDGSIDKTGKIAEDAGACVISHPYRMGNGAAIKTGIRKAKGSTIVMIDGDGQHDPKDIPKLLEHTGAFDMVVGARTRTSKIGFHRKLANGVYNAFASFVCNQKIKDLTSGFRAVKAKIAKDYVYLLPNSFSYPSTLTLAAIRAGYTLKYIPITLNKRIGKSKVKLFKDGIRFFMIIIRISVLFSPLRVFLPFSALLFFLGFCWYMYSVFFVRRTFPPISIVLFLTSVIVFFLGIISDQIAQLRYEKNLHQ